MPITSHKHFSNHILFIIHRFFSKVHAPEKAGRLVGILKKREIIWRNVGKTAGKSCEKRKNDENGAEKFLNKYLHIDSFVPKKEATKNG